MSDEAGRVPKPSEIAEACAKIAENCISRHGLAVAIDRIRNYADELKRAESTPLPSGMVPVPVEPTQAMVDAVLTTIHEREDKYLRERVRADYRAMLAAAKEPKP